MFRGVICFLNSSPLRFQSTGLILFTFSTEQVDDMLWLFVCLQGVNFSQNRNRWGGGWKRINRRIKQTFEIRSIFSNGRMDFNGMIFIIGDIILIPITCFQKIPINIWIFWDSFLKKSFGDYSRYVFSTKPIFTYFILPLTNSKKLKYCFSFKTQFDI